MSILSVDLAYKHYADLGIAHLQQLSGGLSCTFIRSAEIALNGSPNAQQLAVSLVNLCQQNAVQILMIDGPQAWKAADNGLEHSRKCERILNAPAKTGLPGNVKPHNYRPFVSFSIDLFDTLHAFGWHRLDQQNLQTGTFNQVVVETLPLSAWRQLGIKPLPAKRKAKASDLVDALQALQQLIPIHLIVPTPTHDELQALVAGIAGISLQSHDTEHYSCFGSPPQLIGNTWREGFIVTPK